ncbi:MAG: hypothetical protein NT062_25490 [Proteobacteria bacterium]|nr:hypothetical protein [Pseudomonadota bacterium]
MKILYEESCFFAICQADDGSYVLDVCASQPGMRSATFQVYVPISAAEAADRAAMQTLARVVDLGKVPDDRARMDG